MAPDIEQLYRKFLRKECSPEESIRLLDYFRTEKGDEHMVQMIEAALDKPIHKSEFSDVDEFSVSQGREKLLAAIRSPVVKRPIFWMWSAAAAILVLLSVGIYWSSQETGAETPLLSQYGEDVAPGTNRAIVTLSDGTVVELDEDKTGIVAGADGLAYSDGSQIAHTAPAVAYATLATPRGGQYQLTLPDGTRAWINAVSSITYPTRFTDQERIITVTGEVYLEVAHDASKPFIVRSDQQQVEVLGTSFNIDTYGDEGKSITTLTQGRLRVTNTANQSTTVLQPGQQAIVSPRAEISVHEVDTEGFSAWKEGVYSINEQTLDQFARHLARWYDVDVDMGRHGSIRLSAMTSRHAPLSGVLEAIELKTGIKFKIQGRRVTAID